MDPADLWHEVEGLVEVLLPQALVLDELQEVGALDVALQLNPITLVIVLICHSLYYLGRI